MSIDWSVVTLDHILLACEQFDLGTVVPARPARNTFLLLNGRRYPGKFIRGLAYRLATGKKLVSGVYSGGDETVRFFGRLGLQTGDGLPNDPPSQTLPSQRPVDRPAERRYEPQKQALFDLLKKRFGKVDAEAKFPWLVVPQVDGQVGTLDTIFRALTAMRGFPSFTVPGWPLRCDFYIPSHRLIVEYDERQHFTVQRAIALDLYPDDLMLGFDRTEWASECRRVQATDSLPPHRDEQRAFYDSLRDIVAPQYGFRLLRIRAGATNWRDNAAEGELARAIEKVIPLEEAEMESDDRGVTDVIALEPARFVPEKAKQSVWSYLRRKKLNWSWEELVRKVTGITEPWIVRPIGGRLQERFNPLPRPTAPEDRSNADMASFILSETQQVKQAFESTCVRTAHGDSGTVDPISRIGLVSHDYNRLDCRGQWDYSEHFGEINRLCDQEGCDTLLYSLYTLERRASEPRNEESIFSRLTSVKNVVLEVGELYPDVKTRWAGNQAVEFWQRGNAEPSVAWQWFASKKEMKRALVKGFIADLPYRHIADGLLILCGESGILAADQRDQERFFAYLAKTECRLILNPTHDYMKPIYGNDYLRNRSRHASMDGRTSISVWNEGKLHQEPSPWLVFHDGIDCTDSVRELPIPIAERPDVRIGIIDLPKIGK